MLVERDFVSGFGANLFVDIKFNDIIFILLGHHPNLHLVNWNDVRVDIWTHAVGG